MVTDHTGVNKAAVELVTKLKVTPQDNPTSQSLKAGGDKNVAHLKTLTGAAFDKAYVAQEVTYHTAVLDAVDKTLIPNAAQRRAEGAAGQGPAGLRRPPRAREDSCRRRSAAPTSDRRLAAACPRPAVGDGRRRRRYRRRDGAARPGRPNRPRTPSPSTPPATSRPGCSSHPGDTVVWVNKDVIPHTATAKGGVRLEGAGGRGVVAPDRQGERRHRLRLPVPSDDDGHVDRGGALAGAVTARRGRHRHA